MNADGGSVRNLTHNHALEANFPKWSPDGRTIMFSAQGHTALPNLQHTQSIAIASMLLQSALLIGVVLLLVSRWALPFGALTLETHGRQIHGLRLVVNPEKLTRLR